MQLRLWTSLEWAIPDYRYKYSAATYADEITAVLDDVGFGNDAIVVAHSFGGYMAVKAANIYPNRFRGLVLDSGIRHPDDPIPIDPTWVAAGKVYPDRDTALMRFRFSRPSPAKMNTYFSTLHVTL
ncbi:MAG: hypothetical protein CM15mP120_12100 [Pseudomonadota bacterium]|nr:MAG: hypothetical protein CM15mP120_12100 [Pseudomonadota bacterium]